MATLWGFESLPGHQGHVPGSRTAPHGAVFIGRTQSPARARRDASPGNPDTICARFVHGAGMAATVSRDGRWRVHVGTHWQRCWRGFRTWVPVGAAGIKEEVDAMAGGQIIPATVHVAVRRCAAVALAVRGPRRSF